MPKKQGKCINVGGCSKARSKEIQEAELTNFVCEECGKPLHESKAKASKGGLPKPVLFGIVAVVVAVAVILAITMIPEGDKAPQPEPQGAPADTTEVVKAPVAEPDTAVSAPVDTVEVVAPEPVAEPEKAKDPVLNGNGTVDLGVATYSGPVSNGKPHGIGELRFKRNYTLDLKTVPASSLEIEAGETVFGAKFDNGVLKQGEVHRKNGKRVPFIGVAAKLK